MIKDTIQFTDYNVQGYAIAFPGGKRWYGSWPRHWQRIVISAPRQQDAQNKIFQWLEENNRGRYGAYQLNGHYHAGTGRLRLAFENSNDALMFKLQGGDKAYDQD